MKTSHRSGFTLIELLVCVAVIAVLTSIAIPVISGMRKKASMTREISSARRIISGYLAYAADHDGDLMPGFANFPAKDERGKEVHNPVNWRYPWRLAPYLDYDMRSFWGNESDDRIAKAARGDHDGYVYAVSVQPALGINALFVGGDYQVLSPEKTKNITLYGQFCVTRLGQASNAPQLIVFASAAGMYEGQKMTGYFKVTAPNFTTRNWIGDYSEKKNDPTLTGNVDFRYEDRAVAAMLDGHIEMMDFDQMNDMRRWSNQAATAENKNWMIGGSEEVSGADIVSAGTHVTTKPQP